MEALADANWRWLPCLGFLALALLLAVRAARGWLTIGAAGHRNLHHMLAFRKAVMALGLAGIGAGWWLGNPVLFWAGVVIGLEETIESSLALEGLRMEAQQADPGAPRS